jgi:hypothetical protein
MFGDLGARDAERLRLFRLERQDRIDERAEQRVRRE